MKKLFLIRHAKSSWKDESLSDFMRPLSKRGRKNGPFMAEILKQKAHIPDCILSSPSLRTRQTAQIFAQHLGFSSEIIYNESLYEASLEQIEACVKSIDDLYTAPFLVGHNPGLNDFVQKYIGFEQNIVTCGVVEIHFTCEHFSDISPENAHFITFEYPKKEYS